MILHDTQIYFVVTIIMVSIFGVVDTDPSVMNVNSFNLTSTYDDHWSTSMDDNIQQSNDTRVIDVDMETNQIHMSQALNALNICVLVLSSFGLVSTFLLIFGLVQVISISQPLSH